MDFLFDPSLVLYLPLYQLDGASFMSKDACGQVCTVTGALWRPNGRYFDGTDDYILQATLLDVMPSAVTYEAWFKVDALGKYQGILAKINNANNRLNLDLPTDNVLGMDVYGGGTTKFLATVEISKDTWYHAVGVYEAGKALRAYVNTVEYTGEVAPTIGNGTDADFTIGNESHASLKRRDLYGLIGEVRVYNRALTLQEVQHNYLATKWRYQ